MHVPGRTYLLSLSAVHDVRASDLQGSALVLGASRKAVYLSDIDAAPPVTTLDTQSDVFAVAQQQHLIYTGTRSGAVARFDTRIRAKAHRLAAPGSAIVHLRLTRAGAQLLVACMDGRLASYDLRFAARPVVAYAGHVNSVTHRLGVAVDAAERFVFAAGEDARVRGWSLGSGAPLVPPSSPLDNSSPFETDADAEGEVSCSPFGTRFAHPLRALQVTDGEGEGDGDGLCLWGAGGEAVWRWWLGQRAC
ncbi:hypothetical protein B0H10DRAFT_945429 [Mycena sp. CBHHK59/15]|nr:hypothetical protein B0H10DRAFT_945429 [Mycena sp. CBHHK59/15]